MVVCAEMFIALLNQREIRFSVRERDDGGCVVLVPYNAKYTNVIFDGDDDGTHVALRTVFERCPEEKIADLLVVCNALNNQYRWVKFCIDRDNDIMVEDDAIVTPESAGEECFELVLRTANILDEVKPTIMRALFA